MLETNPRAAPNSMWAALLAVYIATALLFSIIQPLGRAPDETAHMQYATFLADNARLPIWKEAGGGEAGYEAQHPPLYYLYTAIFYRLASPLSENWRWHVARWAMILVGCALFFLCRRFFLELFESNDDAFPTRAFAATATVMLMPLTILYTCYANPDGMTLLWVAAGLYLSWKSTMSADWKLLAALGIVCGLAALTKLSGAPIVVIALLAQFGRDSFSSPLKRISIVLLAFVATCGWWYLRSLFLYGTPFIHTQGKLGTGLTMAAQSGFAGTMWFTWRETFLSTWAQRGWFPNGFWTISLYGIVIVAILLAAFGLWKMHRAQDAALRRALNLSGVLLILVFFGHQWAFWTMDVEFNAGGRYMLVAMPAIAMLLISGLSTWPKHRVILLVWLIALPIMNAVSAWNIDTVLNPRYAPEWKTFQFPPGEEP